MIANASHLGKMSVHHILLLSVSCAVHALTAAIMLKFDTINITMMISDSDGVLECFKHHRGSASLSNQDTSQCSSSLFLLHYVSSLPMFVFGSQKHSPDSRDFQIDVWVYIDPISLDCLDQIRWDQNL